MFKKWLKHLICKLSDLLFFTIWVQGKHLICLLDLELKCWVNHCYVQYKAWPRMSTVSTVCHQQASAWGKTKSERRAARMVMLARHRRHELPDNKALEHTDSTQTSITKGIPVPTVHTVHHRH